MTKDFYKYPNYFKTTKYELHRRVDGFHLVYEVKKEGTEETLGSIEIDLVTRAVKERSGWRTVKFSSAKEEIQQYLRGFFLK